VIAVWAFLLAVAIGVAQEAPPSREAHPYARWQWEQRRYSDPRSGIIPADAALKDAQLARRLLNRWSHQASLLSIVHPIGPTNVAGRIRALAFDRRSSQVIMTGGVTGGIWRSIDGGASWVRSTSPTFVPGVSSLVQSVRTPDVWYAGTGEGLSTTERRTSTSLRTIGTGTGIYRSTDNGATWYPISLPIVAQPNTLPTQAWQIVWRLAVAEHTLTETLFAACYGGIYSWSGTQWRLELGDTTQPAFCTEIIAVGDKLYAAMGACDDGTTPSQYGIYVRHVDSTHWQNITPAGFPLSARRIVLAASSDGSVLYVFTQEPQSWNERYQSFASLHTLWRYSSTTGVWSNRSGWLELLANPQKMPLETLGGYCMALAVHPTNPNAVYVGSTDVYLSLDACVASAIHMGGYPYQVTAGSLHPDVHALVFPPNDPGKLYAATDGGIYMTSTPMPSSQAQWTSLNDGLTTTQAYHVALNRAVQGDRFVIAGFQDNSNWYTRNAAYGEPWTFAYGGDGCRVLVAERGNLILASSQFGSVYALDGRSGALIRMPSPPRRGSAFVTEVGYDESLHAVILALDNALYQLRYSRGSFDDMWTQVAILPRNDLITTIAVRDGIVLVGTAEGRLYQCDLVRGTADEIITAPIPRGGFIAALDWDVEDRNRIIVTISNYTLPSILGTWDGGKTWRWVGGSLDNDSSHWGPSVRVVRSLVRDGKRLYIAGTSIGAFIADTLDEQTEWQPLGMTTLGVLPVEAIDVRTTDGYTVIGTHGGGIFSCTLQPGTFSAEEQSTPTEFLVEHPIPNPSSDIAIIRVHLPRGGMVSLQLCDALGKMILEKRLYQASAGIVPILITGTESGLLPPGVYVYRVQWEHRTANGVLVKAH
jgi:hypothetical protein